jgi:plasmid stabilization system protein ParE
MRNNYIISPKAYEDIVQILKYKEIEFGKKQRLKYQGMIMNTIHLISVKNGIGHKRNDLPSTNFSYPVGEHILIYSINETLNEISNVRILHSRMDSSKRF